MQPGTTGGYPSRRTVAERNAKVPEAEVAQDAAHEALNEALAKLCAMSPFTHEGQKAIETRTVTDRRPGGRSAFARFARKLNVPITAFLGELPPG